MCASDGIQSPPIRGALEFVHATRMKHPPRSRDDFPHSRGDKHFVGSRERSNARTDVDSHAGNVVTANLRLTNVDARTNLDTQRLNGGDDRRRTVDRPT